MQTTNPTSTKKFEWLNENSRKFLAAGYLGDGLSAEERIANIAKRAEQLLDMPGFADKFYDYMSQGFYSLASPVWSNFGKERGLPISCFGSHIDDDIGNILYSQSEVGMMSKLGGGTSGYFGTSAIKCYRISSVDYCSSRWIFVWCIITPCRTGS